jgi:hypothetical protein
MTYDSTQVVAAARRARARAIGQGISLCIAALCSDLMAILRTRPLFHAERRDRAIDRQTR